MSKLLKLIIAIIACEAIGVLGVIFVIPSIDTWYQVVSKPQFFPPSYVFNTVWICLYGLIGVSLFFASEVKSKHNRSEFFYLFFASLILNFLWSFIFFYLNQLVFAFIDITALFLLLTLLLFESWKFSKHASIMLIPYFLWVLFAATLNLSVILINQ